MGGLKEVVQQLDLFAHPQFLRYRGEQGYRTVTGGVCSIILIFAFAGIFASLAIDTFQNNIIISQTSTSYDTDPTYSGLNASPDNKFMFAVGITGLDLSSAQRYFDIELDVYSLAQNVRNTTRVDLSPCTLEHWSGVSSQITQSYQSLNLTQWLCPPRGYVFPIEGKKTSSLFKYVKITVSKCGTTTVANASSCVSSTTVDGFVNSNQGATLNFYYINPILNPGDKQFINYYLEDRNYFTFNTNTGISANLFYSEYSIQTDNSILPWEEKSIDEGLITVAPTNSQIYSVINTNQYAKVYLRKSAQRLDVSRSFQKVDQTLSYIGGLLGTVLLLLTFVNLYSQMCYEIEFGDKMFKQNQNGSFGSENFNFIVYLGYGFFNILAKLGIIINWKSMKKYHQCRKECVKQLDIELLFRKIDFFEEVSRVVLEDHHLKGINMLPKKRIRDVRKNRKRFLLQNLIYSNLDRKAREVHVEDQEYENRHDEFMKGNKEGIIDQIIRQQEEQQKDDVKELKQEWMQSFKILKDESRLGDIYSKRIMGKFRLKEVCTAMLSPDPIKYRSELEYNPSVPSIASLIKSDDSPQSPLPSAQNSQSLNSQDHRKRRR